MSQNNDTLEKILAIFFLGALVFGLWIGFSAYYNTPKDERKELMKDFEQMDREIYTR